MSKTKNFYKHIGILSAMPEEIGIIIDTLKNVESTKYGDLELFSGECTFNENIFFITTAWSGWGKVSAARAATRLISKNFKNSPVDIVLFTGVAGAVNKKLKQWDIILSQGLIQHDMDARPLFDKYEIPALRKKKIFPKEEILNIVYKNLKSNLKRKELKTFGSLYKGLIATGDMFISDENKIKDLSKNIPGVFAVEMEGAAFAQVAKQENIDWIVMRVISDGANQDSEDDFNKFLSKYKYKSFGLIKCFLDSLLEINS